MNLFRSLASPPDAGRAALIVALMSLAGCSVFAPKQEPLPPPAEPPKPQYAEPLATHTFPYDPKTTAVVGTLQATIAREEDTLPDIARRFNVSATPVREAFGRLAAEGQLHFVDNIGYSVPALPAASRKTRSLSSC